jgi:hypothetical protein
LLEPAPAEPYLSEHAPPALAEQGPPLPDERPGRVRRLAITAVVVAVVVTALGGAVGWLWAEVTPRLQVIKSDRGFLYADAEPEQPIAADGIFLLVGLGLGILLAVLAWVLLRRYRGGAILVALTVGSLACSVLAYWIGHKIGVAQFNAVRSSAPLGAQLSAPVTLRATNLNFDRSFLPSGVVAGQALAAAFVYTTLAGFSAYEDLGRHRHRHHPEPGQDQYFDDRLPGDTP